MTVLHLWNPLSDTGFQKDTQSPKLKTWYHYENQFWNPGFINGVRQFCGYQFFCYEIFFYLVSSYSQFLSNLLNQNIKNVKTPTRELGSFVQRYSFKFRALACRWLLVYLKCLTYYWISPGWLLDYLKCMTTRLPEVYDY